MMKAIQGINERIKNSIPRPGMVRLIGVVFLCVAIGGCDTVYGWLHKEGAQEKQILGDVYPYQYNETVARIQRRLKIYGYRIGRVDGKLGPLTREAVASFQKDRGLKVSRLIDKPTWEALRRFDACGLMSDEGLRVAGLQRALKEAGMDPGPIDGKMGKRTRAAVAAFQKKEGLKADGKPGWLTLERLAAYASCPP